MESCDSSTPCDVSRLGIASERAVRGSTAAHPGSKRPSHKLTTRSCHQCHQRKIRCDKKLPCSHCARGNTLCHYPGPERRPRRPHKMTITDIATRVSNLERTMAVVTAGSGRPMQPANADEFLAPDEAEASSNGEMTLTEDFGTQAETDPSLGGTLVQDGGSFVYVNEVLLSRILDEERELQSAMGTPQGDNACSPNDTLFSIGAPFSEFRKTTSDEPSYHPSRWQAIQLWRVYINNVDPVCKILHIPTMEAVVFKAANNPALIEHDQSALLFSIYFAASTSLATTDVVNLTSRPKVDILSGFKRGLEQSLAAANFLETPTITSIQAMAIYLNSLRAHSQGRSTWTMYGLLMRSAQCIGLHRDGTNFNLSPFKTEMRRRLWWFMCAAEGRAAEDHGISVPKPILGTSSETRFPSNLDDSDLHLDMRELPASKPNYTGMSFSLAVWETTLGLPQLYRSPDTSSCETLEAASVDKLLTDHFTCIEDKYLKYCNPDIPVQRATMNLARLLKVKAGFVIHQQWLKRANSGITSSNATDESLATACHILEMNLQLQTEDLIRDFHWILSTYTQYYPLTYVLWHLCVKPVGPNIQRAWNVVESTFEVAKDRELSAESGSKWTIMQLLKSKASRRLRESASQRKSSLIDNCEVFTPLSYPIDLYQKDDAVCQDPTSWDISATNFADWSNLVENFNMYDFEN